MLSRDLRPTPLSSMCCTDFTIREKNIEDLTVNQGSEKKQVASVKTLRCDGLEMLWFGFRF